MPLPINKSSGTGMTVFAALFSKEIQASDLIKEACVGMKVIDNDLFVKIVVAAYKEAQEMAAQSPGADPQAAAPRFDPEYLEALAHAAAEVVQGEQITPMDVKAFYAKIAKSFYENFHLNPPPQQAMERVVQLPQFQKLFQEYRGVMGQMGKQIGQMEEGLRQRDWRAQEEKSQETPRP